MKIRLARIIGIPVPEQFQKDWQPIVHEWIEEYNDQYPDDIIGQFSLQNSSTNFIKRGCHETTQTENLLRNPFF